METKKAEEICATKTQARIEAGAMLVDVREREEVALLAFDVPSILNIPLSEFEERFQELPRDKELIMVCKNGAISLKTTYFLLYHGYSNVKKMQYGLVRWVQKGFPTIGDASAFIGRQDTHECCS